MSKKWRISYKKKEMAKLKVEPSPLHPEEPPSLTKKFTVAHVTNSFDGEGGYHFAQKELRRSRIDRYPIIPPNRTVSSDSSYPYTVNSLKSNQPLR